MDYIINRAILAQLITFHRTQLTRAEAIKTDCGSCVNFQRSGQRCTAYNAEIPDDVIPKGCEQWVYDDIPF